MTNKNLYWILFYHFKSFESSARSEELEIGLRVKLIFENSKFNQMVINEIQEDQTLVWEFKKPF